MSGSFFSPEWPNVANLKPKLRPHLRLHRQVQRDRVWHIIEDEATGRHHRLDELAYELASRLDGRATIDDLWEQLVDQHLVSQTSGHAPSQHDVIQLIGSLHQSDLIQAETTQDTEELFYRSQEKKKQKRKSLINPFSFKAPLVNPTALLDRLEPKTRWLFHWLSGLIILMLLISAGLMAIQHWSEISAHAAVHLPSRQFWILAWFVYPVVKLFHELGHAIAVRHWGGKVPEIGVSLLVLMPVPYVNASAANLFPDKYTRMLVSAAGVMVEVLFAAVALFVWLNIGDSLVRDLAFVVMAISGVSTLLFNANPLVKFDGYHFLADWLEIPDLAKRSSKYWSWLAKRYLLNAPRLERMDLAPGESRWLAFYAPTSWAYRWILLFVIVTWMANISLLLAAVVASWFLYSLLVNPAIKIIKYLWQSAELTTKRVRSLILVATLALSVIISITIIPAPFSTMTQGVVWADDESRVRTAGEGFVEEMLVHQGEIVIAGQPLIRLQNDLLVTQQSQLKAKLAAIDARLKASQQQDRTKAAQFRHESETVRAELVRIEEQTNELIIRAKTAGRVILPKLEDLAGRFIRQGETLGYILGNAETQLRAVVRQKDSEKLNRYHSGVSVKFENNSDNIHQANLLRIRPSATNALPSQALGHTGGGIFVTDPSDKEGKTTVDPVFVIDLVVPELPVNSIGNRVWLRFDHGYKPLLQQWTIHWQHLLMQHFSSQA